MPYFNNKKSYSPHKVKLDKPIKDILFLFELSSESQINGLFFSISRSPYFDKQNNTVWMVCH